MLEFPAPPPLFRERLCLNEIAETAEHRAPLPSRTAEPREKVLQESHAIGAREPGQSSETDVQTHERRIDVALGDDRGAFDAVHVDPEQMQLAIVDDENVPGLAIAVDETALVEPAKLLRELRGELAFVGNPCAL